MAQTQQAVGSIGPVAVEGRMYMAGGLAAEGMDVLVGQHIYPSRQYVLSARVTLTPQSPRNARYLIGALRSEVSIAVHRGEDLSPAWARGVSARLGYSGDCLAPMVTVQR